MNTIVTIIAVLSFILNLLRWLKIEPRDVQRFYLRRKRAIYWNSYLVFAILCTTYILFAFVMFIQNIEFRFDVLVMYVLFGWAILGLWTPFIQRISNPKLLRLFDIINFSIVVFVIASFWIIKWPQWLQPTLVTSVLALSLIGLGVVKYLEVKKRCS
jgi:hypothetical protein